MIVEAGCTLAEAQAAAASQARLFPLSLGSEGTAQIGGNLSTNAGGTAVLRYGMMRDLVLGLEVVMADGRVLSALKSLRKDNTGYDVKSLFVGAEGTLGIITAASLKLFPQPADTATALAGIDSPQQALDLLAQLRGASRRPAHHVRADAAPRGRTHGEACPRRRQSARPGHRLVSAHRAEFAQPAGRAGALCSPTNCRKPRCDRTIKDASLATSLAQSQAMWKLRESVPEAQRRHGASLKHDVSVPMSASRSSSSEGSELVRRLVPEGQVVSYGHVGDGNLHFNVSQRQGTQKAAFLARGAQLESAMFDLVERLGGSISAEHGIGRLKAAQFAERADPVELAMMRVLKRALDPKGILNPGKVLA